MEHVSVRPTLTPAQELREWLADHAEAQPPSIHHQTEQDFIDAPPVTQREGVPYFPPDAVPDRYKQGTVVSPADGTADPLGKNPAIEPSRKHDVQWVEDQHCPRCHQEHMPDEPCPDSAVTQFKGQERSWYRRDPNVIHSAILENHMPELGQSRMADVNMERVAALRRYTADDQGHSLWFRPNQVTRQADEYGNPRGTPIPGRGIVHDPSGTVHTWPEAEGTHADMIYAKGLQDRDCTRFYLNPQGVVTQINGPSQAFTQIMGADPRLAEANGMMYYADWEW